ncbi:IPT/TIG domain-containing protein [Kribbella sp. NPDC051952]|uniref:IPT/TIG domain-containing protein n=1 Tax=Kribbella sp. NPDC051952 TaxID=3154851 RepID=UPI003414B4A4
MTWVPFGPAAADSPPPMEWFGRTHRAVLATGAERVRRCEFLAGAEGDTLGRMRSAYRGVGEACLGSLGGDPAHWGAAAAYLNQARKDLAGQRQNCLETSVVSLLQRLVSVHRTQPRSRVQITPASGTACPWGIDKLQLRDPVEGDPGLVAGPFEGGTRVQILGSGLVQVSEVYFGDIRATEFTDGSGFAGQFMYVCSPPNARAGKVRITVKSPGGRRTSPPGEVFEYSAGVSNSPNSECGS